MTLQIHSRQHLGLLEKHKDYVLRAKDYQKKKAELKILHEKVMEVSLFIPTQLHEGGLEARYLGKNNYEMACTQ